MKRAVALGLTTLARGGAKLARGGTRLAGGGAKLAPGRAGLARGLTTLARGGTELAPGGTELAPGWSKDERGVKEAWGAAPLRGLYRLSALAPGALGVDVSMAVNAAALKRDRQAWL